MNEKSKMWQRGRARPDAHRFKKMFGMPSGPEDVEEVSPINVLNTRSGVKSTFVNCFAVLRSRVGLRPSSVVNTVEKYSLNMFPIS